MKQVRLTIYQWFTVRNISYWIPSLLYVLLIFYLSSKPAPEPIKQVPMCHGIKLVHLAEYSVLCSLFLFAIIKTIPLQVQKQIILAGILTFIAGIFDECHQMLVPARTAKLMDVVTNGVAAILVCTLYSKYGGSVMRFLGRFKSIIASTNSR